MNLMNLNLFEMFDPSTFFYIHLNWMMIMMIYLIIPQNIWILPSKYKYLFIMIMKKIFYEFKLLISPMFKMNIIFFLSLMLMILLMNLLSLFPYIFTMTSHLSLNLSMSLPIWVSMIMYGWLKKPKIMLAHFVPLSTPMFLTNFMVLVEMISTLIQPFTLSIRLTANMIAGHLLLTLLGNFFMNFYFFFWILIFIQNMLEILEIAVALIQSYVFSILLILYFLNYK